MSVTNHLIDIETVKFVHSNKKFSNFALCIFSLHNKYILAF